jgi:hypothetical protein
LRGTDLARLDPILDENARTVYGLPE